MKNAMKKLLSLVLVAMLLVSVLPLGAMAATGDVVTFKVVTNDDTDNAYVVERVLKNEPSTIQTLLDNWYHGSLDFNTKVASIKHGADGDWSHGVDFTTEVVGGDFVTVKLRDPITPPPVDEEEEKEEEEKESTYNPITFKVLLGDSSEVAFTKVAEPEGATASIKNLLTYWYGASNVNPNWSNTYKFDHAYVMNAGETKGTTVYDENTEIARGQSVSVRLVAKTNTGSGSGSDSSNTDSIALIIKVNDVTKVQKYASVNGSSTVSDLIKANLDANWTSNYTFNNVIINGTTYGRADVSAKAGEAVTISLSRKFSKDNSNKVYLHVFLNGDASTIVLTKDITGTYLMDDWSTNKTEILNYLKANYYTAKDSTKAMELDGLYLSENGTGTFPTKYYADDNVSKIDDIDLLLEDNFVHISVMLKNAKAKTTSTADSTNPKTGDSIYMTVTVMGLSVAALAAVYYVSKKRVVR